jgi:hypothetical protein
LENFDQEDENSNEKNAFESTDWDALNAKHASKFQKNNQKFKESSND